MGRRPDARQTDTQAHTTVSVAGVILCYVLVVVADNDGFSSPTRPQPIKKWQNKNFEPIEGSGDRSGDRQEVLCSVSFFPQKDRKFYVKVFYLLHAEA